jgi:hypothetical protein
MAHIARSGTRCKVRGGVERRGQSTNLDRIEKSNADFIRFKQLRQSRYVD